MLVLGVLLPGVIGTTVLIQLMYRRNAQAIDVSTLQTSRALLAALDNRLAQARLLAQVLASSTSLTRNDLAAFHREASAAVALPNIANNVVLVDRSGQQLLNTSVELGRPLPRVADLSAVSRVFDGGTPVVGDLVVGNVLRRRLVGVYVPVGGRDAERALLVVVLQPEFDRMLASQRLPPSQVALILDRSGRTVARSHSPEHYVGRLATPQLRNALATSLQGTLRTTLLDGMDVVASYSRSAETGWSVVIGIQAAELELTLDRSIAIFAAGATALLLLSLLLGRLASTRIMRGYESLVDAASALGEARPVAGRRPVIQEASRVHEAMERAARLLAEREAQLRAEMAETSRLNAELDAHRCELQSLVAARTAQLETALHAAQAASRAKSSFLANMSHEIRTPLNAILGLTHLLGRELTQPRQRERLDKVQTAARHLLGLLDDVLDLSKIEAGRMQLQPRRFSLHALLDDVAAIAASLVDAKDLRIEVERGGVPQWLVGDDTRIRQALLNYVGNAVKFTPAGRIGIRSEVLEGASTRVLLRFTVTDTGVGIEPQQLRRLFSPFEQADAGLNRRAGGTGLGLAITREFALLMGGDAGATSTPGAGSSFWFTAWLERDAAPEPPPGDPAPAVADAPVAARRVLVVGAEAVGAELLHAWLDEAGIETASAADGAEALMRLRSGDFDAAVLDTRLPAAGTIDAVALIKAVRGDPRLAALPIVCALAEADGPDGRRVLAAGASEVVAMPPSPDDLVAALARTMPPAPR